MIEHISKLKSSFWSEYIWLPPNTTWQTYERKGDGIQYAQFDDLYYSIVTAVVLSIIRFTLERLVKFCSFTLTCLICFFSGRFTYNESSLSDNLPLLINGFHPLHVRCVLSSSVDSSSHLFFLNDDS